MQTIRLLSGILSFTVPLMWGVLFYICKRRSRGSWYASFFFLSISVLLLTNFAYQIRCLFLSHMLNLCYPLAMTSAPILFLLYLHSLVSVGKPPRRRIYLVFFIPLAHFLYSGYAFYFHYPIKDIWANIYSIIDETDHSIYHLFKAAYIAKEVTSTCLVCGLASMVVIPVYFIPRFSHNTSKGLRGKTGRMLQWFLILLSIAFLLCIATLIYHFKRRWLAVMELGWSTGIFFIGYLMYSKLVSKRKGVKLQGPFNPVNVSLLVRLTRYFNESKPWLTPDLKLNQVASALGTNRTYLSAILKAELQTNFNSFVNSYRIAEAKRLLDQEGNCAKLQEIAIESGFNCYTTFFNAFCKETGMPPHMYVEERVTGL